MRKWLLFPLLLAVLPACSGGDREVVVTRDQLGSSWPLSVNSATVICGGDSGVVLKLGPERYALDEVALKQGLPDAKEVAAEIPVDPRRPEIGTWPGNVASLRTACEDVAALD